MRGKADIHQIDCYNALVEAAIIFVLARLIVSGVCHIAKSRVRKAIRCEEAAAAHAGVDVAALELLHDLLGDIVRHHALGGALGSELCQFIILAALVDVVLFEHVDELRKGRSHPNALLVFDALISLAQDFLDDQGQVFTLLFISRFTKIHKDRYKRRLSVGGQKCYDLILDHLDAALDLILKLAFHQFADRFLIHRDLAVCKLFQKLPADLFTAHLHKRCQVGQGNRLSAILVGSNLRNDLGGDIAGSGETVGLFDQCSGDHCPVQEHVFQIDQIAVMHVLRIVVHIMEVDDPFLMSLYDISRQKQAFGQIFRDFSGHIVPLGGVDHRVFVGVFLFCLFVGAFNQAEDPVIRGIALTDQGTCISVCDVALCKNKSPMDHELMLYLVLNFFYIGCPVQLLTIFRHSFSDGFDLFRSDAIGLFHLSICTRYGGIDLLVIKGHFAAVAFDDLHAVSPHFQVSSK